MIVINKEKCDQCSLCTLLCPADLIASGPIVKESAKSACMECGHCVAVCPKEAITLLGFEDVEVKALSREKEIDRGTWSESVKVGLTMGYPKLKYSREAPRKTMPAGWSKVTG